jgi:tetratricopeptide (TPR) repeat protein
MNRVFDRTFLQYQLAALRHNKYKKNVFFPNILLLLAAVYFYDRPIFAAGFVALAAGVIAYGHFRFRKEANASEEKFDLFLGKRFNDYDKQMKKKKDTSFIVQRYAIGVEIGKVGVDEAIEKITEGMKEDPQSKRYVYNYLLSLHILKYGDETKKIPGEYIEYLDKAYKTEQNINILTEAIKNAIWLKDYSKAIKLSEKAETELKNIKKIRNPAFNAIYRTTIISVPYYKGVAHKNTNNGKKARESFDLALKNCKADKLKMKILEMKN